MTLKYQHTAGRIVAEKDGVSFFDTDAYPVQLFPPAADLVISGQVITFPDLMKGDAYSYARGTIGSSLYMSCASFLTVGYQEWGPSDMLPAPTSGHTLADIVLGTVPDSADTLLVQVKLSRTTTPSPVNGVTPPVLFKEDEWVTVAGGALPTEYVAPLARQIEIRLAATSNGDGTRNVLLSRKQSVRYTKYGYWRSDNGSNNSGWTYGGTAGPYGHIVYQLQAKGPTLDPSGIGSSFQRGQAQQCSLTDVTNYSSVYTGDIKITPVFANIEPNFSGSDAKRLFNMGGDSKASSASSFTFTDMIIGGAHARRSVIVGVSSYDNASSSNPVTGVTIGGVAAIRLASKTSLTILSASLWIADVPLGDTATIVVSYGATAIGVVLGYWVAYNLDVTNTFDAKTESARVQGSSVSISQATVANGFIVGIGMAAAPIVTRQSEFFSGDYMATWANMDAYDFAETVNTPAGGQYITGWWSQVETYGSAIGMRGLQHASTASYNADGNVAWVSASIH